jgi:hypothetical protein
VGHLSYFLNWRKKMKIRKKPVVVEGIQWNGDNYDEIISFTGKHLRMNGIKVQEWQTPSLFISTLEGEMEVKCFNWVIKGVAGEFYPCDPDIFEKTYERIEENES